MSGCIYFFRHLGLTPVKIGYSESNSPIDRFKQFKTYAPYGCEILGFVMVDEPSKVESKLHSKYSEKRLDGEWFEITIDDVNREMSLLMSKNEINHRREFELMFAKDVDRIYNGVYDNEIQKYLDEVFESPSIGQNKKWMTATEIQYMILDKTGFECSSMKELGIELKAKFGKSKYKERTNKYHVSIK